MHSVRLVIDERAEFLTSANRQATTTSKQLQVNDMNCRSADRRRPDRHFRRATDIN
jgi:hypothetical protein